jgi:hypothetical protein
VSQISEVDPLVDPLDELADDESRIEKQGPAARSADEDEAQIMADLDALLDWFDSQVVGQKKEAIIE